MNGWGDVPDGQARSHYLSLRFPPKADGTGRGKIRPIVIEIF